MGATATLVQIALLALPFPAPGRETPTDLERDHLVGWVHTMRVEFATAVVKDGRLVERDRRAHQTVTYDERGFEVERVSFDDDGTVASRSTHEIDAKGNEISWQEYEKSGAGTLVASSTTGHWIRDALGRPKEFYTLEGTTKAMGITYEYDGLGRKSKETRTDDGGGYRQTTTYRYDARGNLTETSYETNGRTQKIIQEYDAGGRPTRYTSVGDAGVGNGEVTYVYNRAGLEIECRSDSEHAWTKVVTTYDARNRVAQRETWIGYKLPNISITHMPEPGRVTYMYDESGRIVDETSYAPEGTVRTEIATTYSPSGRPVRVRTLDACGAMISEVTYDYDSHGNLIRTASDDGSEVSIEDHILTYY